MSASKRQSTIGFKAKKLTCSVAALNKEKNKIPDDCSEQTSQKKAASVTNICATPSTAFSSLTLNSPAITAGLSNARKALHSSSGNLPCREDEIKALETFIYGNMEDGTSGSMYVSGVPGTGKTASLLHIIESEKVKKNCHIVLINCTAVKSSTAIYIRICEALNIKMTSKSEKSALVAIQKYLTRKHKTVLLILDEIDQLESRYQSVLYTIFEWPSKAKSKLLLIGIANAVDLTDRLLPRLSASVKHKPILLHFKPYTKDEICTILKHRLSKNGDHQIFAPGALELISAKVAGQSGDVRRALDLGRRVLEVTRGSREILAETTADVRRSPRKLGTATPLKSNQSPLAMAIDNTSSSQAKSVRASPRVSRSISNEGQKPTPKKQLFKDDKPTVASPRKRMALESNQQLDSSPSKRLKVLELWPETPKTPRKLEDRLKSPRRRSLFGNFSPSKIIDAKLEAKNVKKTLLSSPLKGSPKKCPKTLQEKENAKESVLRRSPRKLTQRVDNEFPVHARDVLTVVNNMYGTAKNLNSSQQSFPIHQKVLICSLLLVLLKGRRKDITVGKLHEVYSRVCSKRGLTAVDQSGFVSMCRQVEMAGAVEVGKGPARLAKITLQWDEAEVAHALQDSSLLAAILTDTASLASK